MAKYKILVVTNSFGSGDPASMEHLTEHDCEVVRLPKGEDAMEFLEREIPTADGIIAGLEQYTPELLAKGKNLKVISRYGVGYDGVPLAEASKLGIAVTNTPGANSDSVADLAMALMLSVSRQIPYVDQSIKNKDQQRPVGVEMWKKTLGIIATGQIGKGVARRAKGFGMTILCYDSYPDEAFAKEVGATYVDLETLLTQSDFVTIHAPYNEGTKNMIDAPQLAMMKKTAVLVNTARGGIINEDALYDALKTGEIYGAGLDATLEEPPYNSPLLELSNVILSPHIGARTTEASDNMSRMAAENVVAVLQTGTCPYHVNKESK